MIAKNYILNIRQAKIILIVGIRSVLTQLLLFHSESNIGECQIYCTFQTLFYIVAGCEIT